MNKLCPQTERFKSFTWNRAVGDSFSDQQTIRWDFVFPGGSNQAWPGRRPSSCCSAARRGCSSSGIVRAVLGTSNSVSGYICIHVFTSSSYVLIIIILTAHLTITLPVESRSPESKLVLSTQRCGAKGFFYWGSRLPSSCRSSHRTGRTETCRLEHLSPTVWRRGLFWVWFASFRLNSTSPWQLLDEMMTSDLSGGLCLKMHLKKQLEYLKVGRFQSLKLSEVCMSWAVIMVLLYFNIHLILGFKCC